MPSENTTARFAAFAHDLKLVDIPAAVQDAAKRAILDWAGVALAGSAQPLADALVAAKRADTGAVTIVGRKATAGIETAALINGAAAHALDFDDYLAEGVIHASAGLAAALLAVAEDRRSTGEDFLTSFVAGYEVHAHLSTVIGHPLIYKGFHPTGVLTHLGSAAGAGKLIGLDTPGLATCLGIAATQAAGLLASFGTMGKPLHAGKAAADGVLSALLAEAGFTGNSRVLDGERGLPAVLAGADPERPLGRELGSRWLLLDNAIKPYAACGAIHAAIDGAIALSEEVRPERIERVECAVSSVTVHSAGIPAPATGLEGKFSTQYAVASALLSGQSSAPDFTDGAVRRPDVRELTARVALLDTYERITEAEVRVAHSDGSVIERKVDWAKGSPGNPMTYSDTVGKFLGLAEPVLGERRARAVVSLIDTLDEQPDAGRLAESLALPRSTADTSGGAA
ncbi:MmgE/PrpD family protein [Amycolatopsis pigmentata]|uniref:MmgE/PrpD family protein n=1 Tax=Amycolatopsis pigmentata TaxID=450801 RepID=A0ABW5GAG9_9PSEU